MSSADQASTGHALASIVDPLTTQMTIASFDDKAYMSQDTTLEGSIDKTISLKHWQSRMSPKLIVIWLDPNINESDDKYHDSIIQLRHIAYAVQVFTEVNQCIDFITNVEDGRFFFILSHQVGMTVVSLINDLPQVDSIYILSGEETKSEQNMPEWRKVRGVFVDILAICDQLQEHFRYYEQNLISTNIFSLGSGLDLDELDQSFMYSVLLKEILLEMNYDEEAKTNFFQLYRAQYSRYHTDLDKINEMENSYNQHSPIWWYIQKPFIYSILNKALRTQDTSSIIKMGFYLKDLHQQIEQVYSTVNKIEKLVVYRGQSMSNGEFEKIKKSQGGLLSCNNFLSTTIDRKIALKYANDARDDPHLTSILFDMEIDPSISKTPFAPLKIVSDCLFPENEILFAMHTVFRIGEMKEIDSRLWHVKMIMTSDTDAQLERLTNRLREEIQGPNELHRLGNLLFKMGQFDEAEQTYNTLLQRLSSNDSDELASIYNQLGNIFTQTGHLEKALSFLEKTLEIRQKTLPSSHPDLASSYNSMGIVYDNMGEYSKALSYYEKTQEIRQKALPSNHPDLAITYNSIGSVYDNMGEYSKALLYYEKTLEIRQKTLPSNHPSLAMSYNDIGSVHQSVGDYPTALLYLEKTRDIQEKTLPLNHPDLATTFNNIGWVYHSMGEYSKALQYLEKSLYIRKISLPSNHPHLATTYNTIGLVYHSMGEYSKGLSCLEKTLDIFQATLPPNHPSFADTYNNIGSIHRDLGDYMKAFSYYEKTLEIRQQTGPPNHPDLAIVYNNMGLIHNCMGKYSEALSSFEKTLQIQQISLPSNHPSLANTYNNIGRVHNLMNDHLKAIASCKKALKIQQTVLPSNHPSLATTYNDIGRAHAAREHYSYALQYYQDALKIQETFLPANHPSLAETYNNVGEMYRLTGNCAAALMYYDKTLKIQKEVLLSSHPLLATTYSNMGQVYCSMKKYEKALSYLEQAREIQLKSLPSNHPSLALSYYRMATILKGLHRYREAVTHASIAVDTISHSIEHNQLEAEKYQQYLNELLTMIGAEDMDEKKESEQWIYPVLLVSSSLQDSPLYSILKNITNGYIMPPILTDECVNKLRSNQKIKNLVLEVSFTSVEEQNCMLKAVSSIDSIESIYLLGKPPATKEERKQFFTDCDKVCMFCEDRDQLAVQLILDMASECRISGNQCTEAGDRDTARQYFQRGMDLYDGLKKFINATPRTVS